MASATLEQTSAPAQVSAAPLVFDHDVAKQRGVKCYCTRCVLRRDADRRRKNLVASGLATYSVRRLLKM